jgi:hypothetical protein
VPFPKEGICELPWDNVGKEETRQKGRLYPLQKIGRMAVVEEKTGEIAVYR